jgi:hypothetical protein
VFWASPTQPSPLKTLTLGFLYKYGPPHLHLAIFHLPLAATSQLHFFSTPSLLLATWRSAVGLLHGRCLPPLWQTRGAQDVGQGNQQLKPLSALSSSLAAKPSHGALLPQRWYRLSPPWQRLPKLLSPAMVGARRCSSSSVPLPAPFFSFFSLLSAAGSHGAGPCSMPTPLLLFSLPQAPLLPALCSAQEPPWCLEMVGVFHMAGNLLIQTRCLSSLVACSEHPSPTSSLASPAELLLGRALLMPVAPIPIQISCPFSSAASLLRGFLVALVVGLQPGVRSPSVTPLKPVVRNPPLSSMFIFRCV